MNFRGRSLRNLDAKGRLMLSPEYRESLYLRMHEGDNTLQGAMNVEQNIIKTAFIEPNTDNLLENITSIKQNISETNISETNIPETSIPETSDTETSIPKTHIIDTNTKSTIIQPASIQEIKLVITTYDNCLAAFSWNDWLKLEEQFAKFPNPSSKLRSFRRLFIGGAEEQIIDQQGRIRLSSDHKEYAKLEKEVTVLGLITRFEIWNPSLLKASIENQCLDDVTEELSSSGIDFAL